MSENRAAFIVHHESSGLGFPWPTHCECCEGCYWTSKENEEAALKAGMKVLCIYCAMLCEAMGEEIIIAGSVRDGKVLKRPIY
jgi:hypothetical protein